MCLEGPAEEAAATVVSWEKIMVLVREAPSVLSFNPKYSIVYCALAGRYPTDS